MNQTCLNATDWEMPDTCKWMPITYDAQCAQHILARRKEREEEEKQTRLVEFVSLRSYGWRRNKPAIYMLMLWWFNRWIATSVFSLSLSARIFRNAHEIEKPHLSSIANHSIPFRLVCVCLAGQWKYFHLNKSAAERRGKKKKKVVDFQQFVVLLPIYVTNNYRLMARFTRRRPCAHE